MKVKYTLVFQYKRIVVKVFVKESVQESAATIPVSDGKHEREHSCDLVQNVKVADEGIGTGELSYYVSDHWHLNL